jgi:ligand-binding sensor domain-containing protein/tRNA A-37 threonylcarbamoyl transferase component Bud32
MKPRGLNFQALRPSLTSALLVVWLVPFPALALDRNKAITQYVHDVWRTDQGLPQNSLFAICHTHDGYLWLGTDEGLVRFDGIHFTVFDKSNTPQFDQNTVMALHEDRVGNLWIGTDGGGLIRLRDGEFTAFGANEGLSHDRVFEIYEDREGSLWIGTEGGGLIRLRDGKFTSYTTKDGLSDNVVYSIREDREGALWIGTKAGGLNRFKSGRFTSFTTKDGLANDAVASIHQDRLGALWIGTRGGLSRFQDGKFTTLTTKDGLSGDHVGAINEDRNGNLWIGTDGGLDRLTDGKLTAFTAKEGLSNSSVLAIDEDREGSLWVGTDGGGLNRFRDGKFTPVTTKEGLSNDQVFSIDESRDGSLWFGTEGGGLNRYNGGTITHLTMKDGLSNDVVYSTCEDREGNLWIGTRGGGLNRYRNGRFTSFTTRNGLSDNVVLAIYEDRQGVLWIGTDKGLNRFKDGNLSVFTTKDGLSNDHVLSIAEDRGEGLWIGTLGGGLNRFRNGTFTPFTKRNGLSNDLALSLYEDTAGSLWIGTDGGGLNRYRDGKFTAITTKQGLFDDVVLQILEDGQGNLWMSCNKGIFRASKKELDAFADGKTRRISCVAYGTTDGMKSAECNGGFQPAGWKARDGRLWFPTSKGAVMIDPAHIPVNKLPPPVEMEEVLVDRKMIGRATAGSPVVLPPGKDKFEFHYTALSFLVPQRVKFKYRLEGLDKEWVDAGTERAAHYTNLSPGKYKFRVIACNDDGVWNEVGATFPFNLTPHFFQTSWFYLLCAFGVVASAAGAHRARVRHLKSRERELVRMVDEKTRDLREANEKISRLRDSSPGASETVPEWSRSMAEEIASAIGAKAIGIWEVDRDNVTPISDSGLTPPSREHLDGLVSAAGHAFVESGEGMIFPVTGMTGELCGALLVSGKEIAWGETETRLVAGFAHQLGATLEMSRLRRQLAAAEERRAATRREMQERGIATLQICTSCRRCYDHTTTACPADGASLESPRPLPYRLLGRYRFLQVLGQGGMGIVLSAHDEKLDRDVAVKLIRPEHFNNDEMKQRFEREARAVARIQHPGVVELHDSGELEDGTAFIVMENLAGCDLGLLLKTYGRGKPAQVASLVRQGCAALRAAHRAGLVHRDVKPENVFLVDDPSGFRVKLLDFGLAKSLKLEKGLTQTGMILGTPAYMAPEQVQGDEVDTRADVYSFAAVVYEALTGRQAIAGNDLGRILMQVLNTVPPPVSSLVPNVSQEVDSAFESALAKDPARRLKDIELWGSSFVELLEKAPGDPATPGWPASRDVFTRLRDSQMERESTHQLPRA